MQCRTFVRVIVKHPHQPVKQMRPQFTVSGVVLHENIFLVHHVIGNHLFVVVALLPFETTTNAAHVVLFVRWTHVMHFHQLHHPRVKKLHDEQGKTPYILLRRVAVRKITVRIHA